MSSSTPVLEPQSGSQSERAPRRWWLILPCALVGLVAGLAPAYRPHPALSTNPPQQAAPAPLPPPPPAPPVEDSPLINPRIRTLEQAILDTQTEERLQAERIHTSSADPAALAAAQHREQLLQLSFNGAIKKLPAAERAAAEADLGRHERQAAGQLESAPKSATQTPPPVESPAAPVAQNLIPHALEGTSFGAIIGILLAVFLRRRREEPEIEDESAQPDETAELAESAALRHLGEIPDLTEFVTTGPYDPFQILGYTLLLEDRAISESGGSKIRSYAITSQHPGAGKTLISAYLGIAFAGTELRVLVIDANLHNPALHSYFELPNHAGLANLLGSQTDPTRESVAAVTIPTLFPRLSILPAGHPEPRLNFPFLPQILALAADDFDLVLIDLPSLESPQSILIAAQCQRTILIVPAEQSAESLQPTLERLATRKIQLAGSATNHLPR